MITPCTESDIRYAKDTREELERRECLSESLKGEARLNIRKWKKVSS